MAISSTTSMAYCLSRTMDRSDEPGLYIICSGSEVNGDGNREGKLTPFQCEDAKAHQVNRSESGSFSCVINNQYIINNMSIAKPNEMFATVAAFTMANLEWYMFIVPNVSKRSNTGKFVIYFELYEMPWGWEEITVTYGRPRNEISLKLYRLLMERCNSHQTKYASEMKDYSKIYLQKLSTGSVLHLE